MDLALHEWQAMLRFFSLEAREVAQRVKLSITHVEKKKTIKTHVTRICNSRAEGGDSPRDLTVSLANQGVPFRFSHRLLRKAKRKEK